MTRYADEMLIGIGPTFHHEAGGIRWPVSDLSKPARAVDPTITDSSLTGLDIAQDIIENFPVQIGTASFPALVEAGLYYHGKQETLGGVDQRNAVRFKPNVWDPVTADFTGGGSLMAHSATFTPDANVAYQSGTAPGSTGYNLVLHFVRKCRRKTVARLVEPGPMSSVITSIPTPGMVRTTLRLQPSNARQITLFLYPMGDLIRSVHLMNMRH